MKVIIPVDILEGSTGLTYTSSIAIGEGDPLPWSNATNYTIGTRVRVDLAKKTYENVVGGVENISPHLGISTHWVEVEYMNRYAMFDTLRRTKSSALNSITIQIAYSNPINALVLLGMINVTSVYVKVTDSNSAIVYEGTGVPSLGTYTNTDIPLITNYTLDIVISGAGTTIYVGACIVGKSEYLGSTQRNISVDTRNYSSIERDRYGYASLTPRGSSPIINKTLSLTADLVNSVERLRGKLNAVPAVWIGMENNEIPEYYNSLVILGFYRRFSIQLDSPIHATVSLELEEV